MPESYFDSIDAKLMTVINTFVTFSDMGLLGLPVKRGKPDTPVVKSRNQRLQSAKCGNAHKWFFRHQGYRFSRSFARR